jgi:hypothetical protein
MSKSRAKRIKMLALLDSGSLAGDFISPDTLISLGVNPNNSVDRLRLPICNGLDNICTDISVVAYKLIISFVYRNYNTSFDNSVFSFVLTVRVLPDTPFDMLTGKEKIKKLNLPLVLPSHFFNKDSLRNIQRATIPLLPRSMLLHGTVSGEKDNRGQAPNMAPPCMG